MPWLIAVTHLLWARMTVLHSWVYSSVFILLCACRVPDALLVMFDVNSSPPSAAYMHKNRVSIGLDNGLSPIRRQAII